MILGKLDKTIYYKVKERNAMFEEGTSYVKIIKFKPNKPVRSNIDLFYSIKAYQLFGDNWFQFYYGNYSIPKLKRWLSEEYGVHSFRRITKKEMKSYLLVKELEK